MAIARRFVLTNVSRAKKCKLNACDGVWRYVTYHSFQLFSLSYKRRRKIQHFSDETKVRKKIPLSISLRQNKTRHLSQKPFVSAEGEACPRSHFGGDRGYPLRHLALLLPAKPLESAPSSPRILNTFTPPTREMQTRVNPRVTSQQLLIIVGMSLVV